MDHAGNQLLHLINELLSQHINDLDEIEGLVFVSENTNWILQILLALTDNAAKYGNINGNIWINAFQHNKNAIRITIKDEGHCIAESELNNVFKPFNRIGVDSKAKEGKGADLSILKGLIDAMNGQIGFTTQHVTGTTFWIDLQLQSTWLFHLYKFQIMKIITKVGEGGNRLHF